MTPAFFSLDHNATTDPFVQVISLVSAVMVEGGNPSAVHAQGRAAQQRLETARRQLARLCASRARDVTFYGSATEANNALLHHFASQGNVTFLRPAFEHAAVLAPWPGGQDLPLGSNGVVDLDCLRAQLIAAPGPVLLAHMAANNETGQIYPSAVIGESVAEARSHGAQVHYHIDGVQAAGKYAIDFTAWGADSLALSSHKLGGPQGVGALITRPGFDLLPHIRGGGQERRRRAGTENVAGIAGFGLACELAQETLETSELQARLEAGLIQVNPAAQIVAQDQPRLTNTTCVLSPGKDAQTLLMQFDLAGIGVSSGSACSSGKVGASHILAALGVPAELGKSALRISLGRHTTAAHIDAALSAYEAACR